MKTIAHLAFGLFLTSCTVEPQPTSLAQSTQDCPPSIAKDPFSTSCSNDTCANSYFGSLYLQAQCPTRTRECRSLAGRGGSSLAPCLYWSSVYLPCDDNQQVVNYNGELKCSDSCPDGTYTKECPDRMCTGDKLYSHCKGERLSSLDGGYYYSGYQTSLKLPCKGDIKLLSSINGFQQDLSKRYPKEALRSAYLSCNDYQPCEGPPTCNFSCTANDGQPYMEAYCLYESWLGFSFYNRQLLNYSYINLQSNHQQLQWHPHLRPLLRCRRGKLN
jgi:hypothetical protein